MTYPTTQPLPYIITAIAALAVGYAICRFTVTPLAQGIPAGAPVQRAAASNNANLSALHIGNGAWVANWDVESFSMSAPIYGNLIPVIMPISKAQLRLGDLAVFKANDGRVLCHQVTFLGDSGFIAAGNNNDSSDGWISYSDLVGVAIQFHLYR